MLSVTVPRPDASELYDDQFGLVCVHTFSALHLTPLPLSAALPVQTLGSEQPGGQGSSAHAACETWGDASASSVTGCVSSGEASSALC